MPIFQRVVDHHHMLLDRVRMDAYRRAIAATVKPGDVVIDLGTGSGVLAAFAAQAGARRVYAIEKNAIIHAARRLAEHNGLAEKIVFVRGHSHDLVTGDLSLPEKADVLVTETMGPAGIDEQMLESVAAIREHVLKPGAAIIPGWLELCLVPMEAPRLWETGVGFWSNGLFGVDFSPVGEEAAATVWAGDYAGSRYLAEPVTVSRFDPATVQAVASVHDMRSRSIVTEPGCLHGLLLFMRIGLTEKIVLSTAPDQPVTHWDRLFFPMRAPVAVQPGDVITGRVQIKSVRPVFWYWKITVTRAGQVIGQHATVSVKPYVRVPHFADAK